MTEMMSRVENTEDLNQAAAPTGLDGLDEQLITQLVDRAKTGGLQLTGEGGVLQQLIKRLLESARPAKSPTTSAMTSTIPLAGAAVTPATGPAPKRS